MESNDIQSPSSNTQSTGIRSTAASGKLLRDISSPSPAASVTSPEGSSSGALLCSELAHLVQTHEDIGMQAGALGSEILKTRAEAEELQRVLKEATAKLTPSPTASTATAPILIIDDPNSARPNAPPNVGSPFGEIIHEDVLALKSKITHLESDLGVKQDLLDRQIAGREADALFFHAETQRLRLELAQIKKNLDQVQKEKESALRDAHLKAEQCGMLQDTLNRIDEGVNDIRMRKARRPVLSEHSESQDNIGIGTDQRYGGNGGTAIDNDAAADRSSNAVGNEREEHHRDSNNTNDTNSGRNSRGSSTVTLITDHPTINPKPTVSKPKLVFSRRLNSRLTSPSHSDGKKSTSTASTSRRKNFTIFASVLGAIVAAFMGFAYVSRHRDTAEETHKSRSTVMMRNDSGNDEDEASLMGNP